MDNYLVVKKVVQMVYCWVGLMAGEMVVYLVVEKAEKMANKRVDCLVDLMAAK